MKAEKILTLIENAMKEADKQTADTFGTFKKYARENDAGLELPGSPFDKKIVALALLYVEAEKEYNNEIAKTAGRLDAKKAAERMITELRRGRPQAGKIKTPDGKYIYYTGCHGIRIADAFDVPDCQGATPEVITKCFDTCAQNNGERLTAPSIAELKNIIRQTKEENKGKSRYAKKLAKYDFGEGLPMVDAQRLLDILQSIGDCTITAAANNPTVSGLYLNSKIGDAVLLPIRK